MTLISKEKRNNIVEHFKNKCDNRKLSKKSLGIMMRSFHMSTPVFFILISLFAPKHIVWVVIFLLVVIFLMFFIFDGCILSMIENKVCNNQIIQTHNTTQQTEPNLALNVPHSPHSQFY